MTNTWNLEQKRSAELLLQLIENKPLISEDDFNLLKETFKLLVERVDDLEKENARLRYGDVNLGNLRKIKDLEDEREVLHQENALLRSVMKIYRSKLKTDNTHDLDTAGKVIARELIHNGFTFGRILNSNDCRKIAEIS